MEDKSIEPKTYHCVECNATVVDAHGIIISLDGACVDIGSGLDAVCDECGGSLTLNQNKKP